MPTPEELFDLRIVERHIEREITTQDAYQAYLDSLEDCASLAAKSDVRFVHTASEDTRQTKRD